MNQSKYAAIGALGVVLIVVGSLLFAAVVDNDDGGNTFGRIFVGALGVSSIILGIGSGIASAATYLARRE